MLKLLQDIEAIRYNDSWEPATKRAYSDMMELYYRHLKLEDYAKSVEAGADISAMLIESIPELRRAYDRFVHLNPPPYN